MIQMKAGGAEKLVYEIISEIDRSKFEPSIAWFKDFDMIESFKKLNIPLYYVPKRKRIDFQAMYKLSKIIRQNNIQIINAHHLMPLVYSYYSFLVSHNVKLVYTEHSMWEIETRPFKWNLATKYMLRKASAIIGVSPEISNYMREKYKINTEKVHYVRNGVKVKNFSMAYGKKLSIDELKDQQNKIKIVMVANFRRNKNHIFLLNAFKELHEQNKNVHLVFIGQGFNADLENSEDLIRKKIMDLGLNENVSLLGYRDNIPELLSLMDIACLTSDKEGLPISLIESMAAGLPVVGTNVEGINSVIVDNYNGFLVEPNNIKNCYEVLKKLSEKKNMREIFGERSKKLALEKFNFDNCILKYQKLFTSIVSQQ